MRPNILVYISGPIAPKYGFSVEENVAVALKVFLELTKRGILSFCPHLTAAFPSAHSEVAYEKWMEYDLAMIDRCTHILMLPRWGESKGAIDELNYAVVKNVQVAYTVVELLEMLKEE